jgi:hypothetical protein
MGDLKDGLDWVRKQSDIPTVQLVTAYRAGAAASEARIKALEEALAFIAAMETERSNATVRRMARVANAALLKEPDQ